MKRIETNRSLLSLIFFSILTLGMYFFYHRYCMIRDINVLCAGDGKRTPNLLLLIPLWLCTFSIYGIIWNCQVAGRLRRNLDARRIPYSIGGASTAFLTILGRQVIFLGLIPQHSIIHATNALASCYNRYCAHTERPEI